MASKYVPIRGLCVRHGFHKSVYKGEDAWTQKPAVPVRLPGTDKDESQALMDVFGIFDGHGGKQAAVYASRQVLDKLLENISRVNKEIRGEDRGGAPAELIECEGISEEDWKAWSAQDTVIASLPRAFVQTFDSLEKGFYEHLKVSGTTSTVAALVGWELIVANVGDSCAYLDTGSEVLQVSGNHRLDDNKKEQERIRSQGFELSSSKVEGRPCGPLRVWPGGLAMGRSLGDFEAGEIVLCEPEVRQVTLPELGGRVVIASDGLWDAVSPKTALHHVRGMPASKAAHELTQLAWKGRELRDDITVLVVDAVPGEHLKLPPQLSKDGSGAVLADAMSIPPVNVYHPLEDTETTAGAWKHMLWQRRLSAVQSAFPHMFASDQADDAHLSEVDGVNDSGADKDTPRSDASETLALHFSNSSFADLDQSAVGETLEEGEWESVASKSKPVPNSRKHALSASEGSPSDPLQMAKALREATPSPAFSPMLSSDLGSHHDRSRGGRGGFGRRGRSRGRGRSTQAAPVPAAHQHIHGFDVAGPSPDLLGSVPPGFQPHSHIHVQAFGSPVSFLEGGGFSLQPEQAPSNPQADGHATRKPGKSGRGQHRHRGPRQHNAGNTETGEANVESGAQNAVKTSRGRSRYHGGKPRAEQTGEATVERLAEKPRRGRGGGRGRGRGRGRAQPPSSVPSES